jgi:hypothetical protein
MAGNTGAGQINIYLPTKGPTMIEGQATEVAESD